MRDDSEVFDLEKLRLSDDVLPTAKPSPSPKGAGKLRQNKRFVMIPIEWMDRLKTPRYAATLPVMLYLHHQSFKKRSRTIRLTNAGLQGMPRWQKRRALAELEALGLVSVERHAGKSPKVTLL